MVKRILSFGPDSSIRNQTNSRDDQCTNRATYITKLHWVVNSLNFFSKKKKKLWVPLIIWKRVAILVSLVLDWSKRKCHSVLTGATIAYCGGSCEGISLKRDCLLNLTSQFQANSSPIPKTRIRSNRLTKENTFSFQVWGTSVVWRSY